MRAGVVPDCLTYAQVVGVVNDASTSSDYVLTASGGMPGELHGGWRTGDVSTGTTSGSTMDLEYGFSCMGYEIVAPWGAAMARQSSHPDGLVTSIFGDGSYLMMNSELYSAAFSGHGFVAVVCDNFGYVDHRWATLEESVGWITSAGGVAVVAHPARYKMSGSQMRNFLDDFKVAAGTSGLVLSLVDSAAAWVYINRGAVLPMVAVPSVVGMMLGARIGASLLNVLKGSVIRKMVITLLLFAGIRALLKGLGVWI